MISPQTPWAGDSDLLPVGSDGFYKVGWYESEGDRGTIVELWCFSNILLLQACLMALTCVVGAALAAGLTMGCSDGGCEGLK